MAAGRAALSGLHAVVGAAVDRWLNRGTAGSEYLDHVRADRPAIVPPQC